MNRLVARRPAWKPRSMFFDRSVMIIDYCRR
jgi:hypothetical protein